MSGSDEASSTVDKGKGRALPTDPSERTPLLASQSFSPRDDVELETSARARRSLWYRLAFIFLITLSICIIAFVAVALIAYSYAARASLLSPDDILDQAVVLKGPDRLDVLNVTEDGGIWLQVEGRIGLDAGAVIGVNSDKNDGIFRDIWKNIGRWGIQRLRSVTVEISTIRISPEDRYSTTLASLDVPPINVPLTANPSSDLSWLTAISVPVFLSPTQNATTLGKFIRDSWSDGTISVHAYVGKAVVHGGSLRDHSWRNSFENAHSNINTEIHIDIPQLPGLPSPGHNAPFPKVKDLITLQTFGVSSTPDILTLFARVTVVDPAPESINFTAPALPFTISLPSTSNGSNAIVPVASVETLPFSLTHPNITLHITGTVLPIPTTSNPTLSAFLTNYLSGKASPIIIASPYFPSHTIETDFPAPVPKPRILRNVTINDMKLVPKGTNFVASGMVYARVVLPKGMKVSIDVNRVLPDVLVFDGEVPASSLKGHSHDGEPFPAPPLPDPLPERAFARLRPDDWLPSTSEADESEGDEGSIYTVIAEIVDVPLQVLPGRQKDFSNFIGKVVFGTKGAVAGLLGHAAVAIDVEGLPNGSGEAGEMELSGLPFQGAVLVGKKGL